MRPRGGRAVIVAIVLLTVTAHLLLAGGGSSAAGAAVDARIFYVGPDGPLKTALDLGHGHGFEVTTRLDDLTAADGRVQAVVVNGDPGPAAQAIVDAYHRCVGVFMIMGSVDSAPWFPGSFLGGTWTAGLEAPRPEAVSLAVPASADGDQALSADPLVRSITWNSAPQVRERTTVSSLPPGGEVAVAAHGTDEPILFRLPASPEHGPLYVLTPWLTGAYNQQFKDWAYFNYLIYNLTAHAAGQAPLAYADYPASPVPHAAAQKAVVTWAVILLSITLGAYILVRRYSLRHPEMLTRIVADPKAYEALQGSSDWDVVGFHRPLGGLLFLFTTGIAMFIPIMLFQGFILPNYILPSAQALGVYAWIVSLFNSFWILFDLGTSVAFVKYFGQYRVTDPARGVKFIQFYVWWQATSGTLQLVLVMLVASFLVPRTAYAYMAYSFVLHAIIQAPGFQRVYQVLFQGLQRGDYNQLLNLVAVVGPAAVQAGVVVAMYRWGLQHPIFGGPMGGIFGMGLSAWVAELAIFFLGLWLFTRMGFSSKVVFMAHFDSDTVRQALRFGAVVMSGNLIVAIGNSLQVWLISRGMVNYGEVMGNWNLVQNLIFIYMMLSAFADDLVSTLSEAFNNGRVVLTRYYVGQAWKYGGLFACFFASALAATGDRFILGALGPEWIRAAQIMTVMTIWGVFQYPAQYGDAFQRGLGRPAVATFMMTMEQVLRIALMFLLVRRHQLGGLIAAYFVALPTKDIVAWTYNHFRIMRLSINVWQAFVAPVLAGLANYGLVRVAGAAFWHKDIVSSVVLLFVGCVVSLVSYMFFYGLFGGWDEDGLREFRRAAQISSFGRPIAAVMAAASVLGGRLSPLHNRFPVAIHKEAMEEADSLTAERVKLTGMQAG